MNYALPFQPNYPYDFNNKSVLIERFHQIKTKSAPLSCFTFLY